MSKETNSAKAVKSFTLADAAEAYARAGLKIFPILDGTKYPPLIKQWGVQASSDPKQIAAWWERWPNANIGLACGPSGVGVVDVDPPDGETTIKTLADFEGKNLTPTKRLSTPRKGVHHLYRGRVATTTGKIGLNVDTRGVGSTNGGYTLFPPSRTVDGPYTWEDHRPMVPLDQWVVDMCGAPTDTGSTDQTPLVEQDTPDIEERARFYLTKDAPLSKQGAGGDETLVKKVAPTLKDMGCSEELAGELLAELWNDRCEPPWQLGDCADADNLYVKIHNGYLYCVQNPPGVATPDADFANMDDIKEAKASATKAAADLRAKKKATWDSLKRDYVYVTQQEVFVSRTEISPDGAPAQYSVRGFDRKFGYVKRELELGRTKLTDYIFERTPGTGFDFFESFSYMPDKPEDFYGNLNLWRKSGIEPKQGDVRWFHDHVKWLFADDAKHVLNWMAWVLQHQDLHPKHALLIHGEHQGTGKSVIANTMRRLLGTSNCTLLDQSALELDHDGWKVRTKLLIIEEVRPGFGSSNAVMKKLHPLISEDTVHVDMKNRNDFDMTNVMAVLDGSNKPDALTMDDSDRRHCIVSTDRNGVILKPKPKPYYRTIYGKDGVGGYLNDPVAMAALAYDLLNRPLGDYSAQDPAPFTAAKGRMIEQTAGRVQKWLLDNPPSERLVNVNRIVQQIGTDAPDIVHKHRGDIRSDIEDVLRRKFNGRSIKGQIRPWGRKGKLLRVWAIGPKAAATELLGESKLNAIYREDHANEFKGQKVDDADEDFAA
jgi:hypothetical protein